MLFLGSNFETLRWLPEEGMELRDPSAGVQVGHKMLMLG